MRGPGNEANRGHGDGIHHACSHMSCHMINLNFTLLHAHSHLPPTHTHHTHTALQLLSQFSRGPTGPLSGVWTTIDYLQVRVGYVRGCEGGGDAVFCCFVRICVSAITCVH